MKLVLVLMLLLLVSSVSAKPLMTLEGVLGANEEPAKEVKEVIPNGEVKGRVSNPEQTEQVTIHTKSSINLNTVLVILLMSITMGVLILTGFACKFKKPKKIVKKKTKRKNVKKK